MAVIRIISSHFPQPKENKDLIEQVARLADTVTVSTRLGGATLYVHVLAIAHCIGLGTRL